MRAKSHVYRCKLREELKSATAKVRWYIVKHADGWVHVFIMSIIMYVFRGQNKVC